MFCTYCFQRSRVQYFQGGRYMNCMVCKNIVIAIFIMLQVFLVASPKMAMYILQTLCTHVPLFWYEITKCECNITVLSLPTTKYRFHCCIYFKFPTLLAVVNLVKILYIISYKQTFLKILSGQFSCFQHKYMAGTFLHFTITNIKQFKKSFISQAFDYKNYPRIATK